MGYLFRFLIPLVQAAEPWDPSTLGQSGTDDPDVATIGSIVPLLKNIISAVLAFAGVVLFLMLVVGGFSYLFSAGDPKQTEKARATITNAIIGLIVIIASYAILLMIEKFTGVPITTFTITQ